MPTVKVRILRHCAALSPGDTALIGAAWAAALVKSGAAEYVVDDPPRVHRMIARSSVVMR